MVDDLARLEKFTEPQFYTSGLGAHKQVSTAWAAERKAFQEGDAKLGDKVKAVTLVALVPDEIASWAAGGGGRAPALGGESMEAPPGNANVAFFLPKFTK